LDQDLLLDLNQVVHDNQLAYLPFARSGRAEALLFDQYPELAERIERGKRAKIDAIVLSNKYAGADGAYGSFRAQSLEEVAASPLRQRNRRRASKEAKSPALTPQLKGKNSAADLMFEMSDGEDGEDEALGPIKAPQFGEKEMDKSVETPLGSPESSWPPGKKQVKQGVSLISPTSLPPSAIEDTRAPGQPWGTAPLASEKLDLRDIMAQTSSDKPSGLALGLAREEHERTRSGSSQPKMSQKERKRLQQAQLLGMKMEAPQPAPPAVSPWQATSQRKSSPAITPAATPVAQPSPKLAPQPSPARAASTPQLTMRQTIAKSGNGKRKGKEAAAQEAASPASERGMSVSTTPIPTPHSVRHIPLPSHSPTSPSQNLSIMEILSLQEAEKVSIRDAAAKRSLEEIQQEQEFQQWWEQESRRAILEEEQQRRATERSLRGASRGRGKGRAASGVGASKPKPKTKEKKDGNTSGSAAADASAAPEKESQKESQKEKPKDSRPRNKDTPKPPPKDTAAPDSTAPKQGPRHENSERGRGRGRGGGRGNRGGAARGGRVSQAQQAPQAQQIPPARAGAAAQV
jgi:hypothetical protein